MQQTDTLNLVMGNLSKLQTYAAVTLQGANAQTRADAAQQLATEMRRSADALQQEANQLRLPPGYTVQVVSRTEYQAEGPDGWKGPTHADMEPAIIDAEQHATQSQPQP